MNQEPEASEVENGSDDRNPSERGKPSGNSEPKAQAVKPPAKRLDPTRYGDWEKDGRCIDF